MSYSCPFWHLGRLSNGLSLRMKRCSRFTTSHPGPGIRDIARGLQSWESRWIDTPKPPRRGVAVPLHLQGKKNYQEFWALDRNIQT